MPDIEQHLFDITRAIQLAVAPVFLLTAIGTIINALTGRLARAVERRRQLEDLLPAYEGEARDDMAMELVSIARRIRLTLWAIALAVLSALLVCLLISFAFIGGFALERGKNFKFVHCRRNGHPLLDRAPSRLQVPVEVQARSRIGDHQGLEVLPPVAHLLTHSRELVKKAIDLVEPVVHPEPAVAV